MNLEWLTGKQLARAEKRVDGYIFDLCDGSLFLVECPWRLLAPDQILVTSEDDGARLYRVTQQGGLESIVGIQRDATRQLTRQLENASIVSAKICAPSNDLTICFDTDSRLEFIQTRSHGSGWCLHSRSRNVVALGHKLSVHSKSVPKPE